jgi:predicted PurR-regulated permease PerM
VAWSVGPYTLLWTAALYLAIQQLENYVVSPLLAERLVSVPPVVGLFAVVAFGLAFGPIGVVLAFPLAVVTMVMIVKLYVQPELHEPVAAPGESQDDAKQAQEREPG